MTEDCRKVASTWNKGNGSPVIGGIVCYSRDVFMTSWCAF